MKQTPLHKAHKKWNAKMGEFAGYDMPLYYDLGVLKEHEWVRKNAGLFDVSHMGQVMMKGAGTRTLLEKLTPSSFEKLGINRTKYTVLLNDEGGIIDDLMVTKTGEDDFHLVINAGCKDKDIAWIKSHLGAGQEFTYFEDWALIALQGPKSEDVMRDVLGIDLSDVPYMGLWYRGADNPNLRLSESPNKENFGSSDDRIIGNMFVSRLGYTGEDGFEISVPNENAEELWNKLLSDERVKPIGLAARDSLRLEMGYCLYGHDIDTTTTPLEADLGWVMRKDMKENAPQPTRKRVGVILTDKGVAREGSEVLNMDGQKVGTLTSGGFSPTLKQSIGQAYVPTQYASEGTELLVDVRGRRIPARIAKMPFVKPKTKGSV